MNGRTNERTKNGRSIGVGSDFSTFGIWLQRVICVVCRRIMGHPLMHILWACVCLALGRSVWVKEIARRDDKHIMHLLLLWLLRRPVSTTRSIQPMSGCFSSWGQSTYIGFIEWKVLVGRAMRIAWRILSLSLLLRLQLTARESHWHGSRAIWSIYAMHFSHKANKIKLNLLLTICGGLRNVTRGRCVSVLLPMPIQSSSFARRTHSYIECDNLIWLSFARRQTIDSEAHR